MWILAWPDAAPLICQGDAPSLGACSPTPVKAEAHPELEQCAVVMVTDGQVDPAVSEVAWSPCQLCWAGVVPKGRTGLQCHTLDPPPALGAAQATGQKGRQVLQESQQVRCVCTLHPALLHRTLGRAGLTP